MSITLVVRLVDTEGKTVGKRYVPGVKVDKGLAPVARYVTLQDAVFPIREETKVKAQVGILVGNDEIFQPIPRTRLPYNARPGDEVVIPKGEGSVFFEQSHYYYMKVALIVTLSIILVLLTVIIL